MPAQIDARQRPRGGRTGLLYITIPGGAVRGSLCDDEMVEAKLSCDQCPVRHRSLCAALTSEELARLSQIARQRTIVAGQVILSDNETPDYFANVMAGLVKLTKTLPDGRQQIVGLQFQSDFIGRPFGIRSPYFAEAATDVQLCCYPKRLFEALLRDFPGLQHRLFEHTLDELDAAREWMLLLGRKTAAEKVASFLLMIARRMIQADCRPHEVVRFELPLSRAEMGDYLGLTIETVSRQITRLRALDMIEVESGGRSFSVPDLERLERAAQMGGAAFALS